MSIQESIADRTRRIVHGEREAITWYYENYFDLMFREAKIATGSDEATCLDIVQDSMLKVLRCMKIMSSNDQLRNWTRRLVCSVAIDHIRRTNRRFRRERIVTNSDEGFEQLCRYDEIEARLIWLSERISAMDSGASQILRLRFFEGWTLQRIGTLLGIKTGAVDGRIQRLLSELRTQAEIFERD